MSIVGLLPLIVLGQLIYCFRMNGNSIPEAVVKGALCWALLAALSLEILGVVNSIHFTSLLVFWSGLAVGALVYIFRKQPIFEVSNSRDGAADHIFTSLAFSPWIILAVTGVIAFLSPPNNWDSLTYHLSRVEHWQQAGTLAHYPTAIDRQVSFTPLAEMLILHLRVLSGDGNFSNLVQTLAFAGCITISMLVAKRLGAPWQGQVLAAILVATLPMAILQGSTTQNDLVVSFFVLAAIERLLAWRSTRRWWDAVGFSAAVGLAILAKPTAYFFAAPMVLLFAKDFLADLSARNLLKGLALAALVLAINIGHYQRNFAHFGTPLGITTGVESYEHTPGALFSSIIRNTASNFATSSPDLNRRIVSVVIDIHKFFGLDANNPNTTMHGKDCVEWWCKFGLTEHIYHEDYAPSPLHLGLFILSTVIMLWATRRDPILLRSVPVYVTVVVAGMLIFLFLMAWNPWVTRYHLMFFVLMAPAMATVLTTVFRRSWLVVGSAILLLAALPPLFDNEMKPFMSVISVQPSAMPKPWDIMFRARGDLYPAYRDAVATIDGRAASGVGLVIGHDSWEYPLWLMFNGTPARPPVRIEHVCLLKDDKPVAGFRPEVLLLVDRPAPQTLTCAQGMFEHETTFPVNSATQVHVYHALGTNETAK